MNKNSFRTLLCVVFLATLAFNSIARAAEPAQPAPTVQPDVQHILKRGNRPLVQADPDDPRVLDFAFPDPVRPRRNRTAMPPLAPTPKIIVFFADKTTIKPGEKVELKWEISGVSDDKGIYIGGNASFGQNFVESMYDAGTTTVQPTQSTAYVLFVRKGTNTITQTVIVNVVDPNAVSTDSDWPWWLIALFWLLLPLSIWLGAWLIARNLPLVIPGNLLTDVAAAIRERNENPAPPTPDEPVTDQAEGIAPAGGGVVPLEPAPVATTETPTLVPAINASGAEATNNVTINHVPEPPTAPHWTRITVESSDAHGTINIASPLTPGRNS